VLIVVFLVLASPPSSLEGRARLVGPVYLWRNTERREKERSPSTTLPGLRSVVSSLLTLQSKVASLIRSLELVSSVLSF
jgi:hypothetical protein